MTHLPAAAHRLFARQHGVASNDQLMETGLTRHQLVHLERCGALVSVVYGAYASPSAPRTELMRCAAITLARPHVAIAGPTAGRIWGFRRLPPDRRIHLLAPPGANPAESPAFVTFHTKAFTCDDIVQRDDGIRITTQIRTALDLARHLGGDSLLSVIEQAMHDAGATTADMRAIAAPWLNRRPWVKRFWHALDRRLDGDAAESDPEVRVGVELKRAGVVGLVRQFPQTLPGFGPVRFDLAVPDLRWAVEVDVFPTHDETVGAMADARRDRAARSIGWSVLRISRADYEHDFDQTIARTVADYRRRRQRSA